MKRVLGSVPSESRRAAGTLYALAMKVTPVAAALAATLVLVSCTSSGTRSSHGSTSSPPDQHSTAGSTPPTTPAAIRLPSEDPCSLVTTKQVSNLVGVVRIYQKTVPYDVEAALKDVDTANKTTNAAGYHGHAKTCTFSDSTDASNVDAAGVSITLVIDTGTKSSYTLLGYGHTAENDLSNRIGVPSERNPINNFVEAVLTDKAWVILIAKKSGGQTDPELSIALAKLLVANLRH
jgi:hypothetical protein